MDNLGTLGREILAALDAHKKKGRSDGSMTKDEIVAQSLDGQEKDIQFASEVARPVSSPAPLETVNERSMAFKSRLDRINNRIRFGDRA